MNIVKPGRLGVLFVLLTAMALSTNVYAAANAKIDREKIFEGETFTLIISTDDMDASEPNLSVLEKDFHILGSGSSQQVQVINGVRSGKRSWNISMQPKRSGRHHIPPLRVGKTLTNPIQLEISAPPEVSSSQDGQPVFIEVEVTNPDQAVYVQQQVLYTIRLIFERPILDGSLSEPVPEYAVVERLGQDSQYTINRDGRSLNVIERKYAIFPEKSGELNIPPIRFNGRLASPPVKNQPGANPRTQQFFGGDPFAGLDSFFDRGETVMLRSKSASLDVLPRPLSYSGSHWLPSPAIELVDSWTEQPPELKVGEPVSRTITINAKGLLSTQLPQLETEPVDGISQYPESPLTETRTDGTWVYTFSKQAISYMPTREGTVEIPEMQLVWWDTENAKEEKAVLPRWTFNVMPGAGKSAGTQQAGSTGSMGAGEPGGQASQPDKTNARDAAGPVPASALTSKLRDNWHYVAIALAIICLLYLLLRRRANSLPGEPGQPPAAKDDPAITINRQSLAGLMSNLEDACKRNDGKAASEILLKMAALARPDDPPATLPALAAVLNSGSEQINRLDRILYASGNIEWNGMEFYQAFKGGFDFREAEQGEKQVLAPLYPDT